MSQLPIAYLWASFAWLWLSRLHRRNLDRKPFVSPANEQRYFCPGRTLEEEFGQSGIANLHAVRLQHCVADFNARQWSLTVCAELFDDVSLLLHFFQVKQDAEMRLLVALSGTACQVGKFEFDPCSSVIAGAGWSGCTTPPGGWGAGVSAE